MPARDPDKRRATARRRYQERKAEGFCARCCDPLPPDWPLVSCARCTQRSAGWQKRNRARRRAQVRASYWRDPDRARRLARARQRAAYERRPRAGHCVTCGRFATAGGDRCKAHREAA